MAVGGGKRVLLGTGVVVLRTEADQFIVQMQRAERHTKNSADRMERAVKQSTGVMSGFLKRFGAAMTVAFAAHQVFGFVRNVTGAFKSMISTGISFNAQMEKSRLSIASLIASFGNVEDLEGRRLEGVEKFNAAQKIALNIQEQMRVKAIQTTAEYEDLMRSMEEGIAPALAAGFDESQITDFTTAVTQATSAIGLPMRQLGQEIRALFEGSTRPIDRLAKLIYGNMKNVRGEVQKLKDEGKLFDFVMEKLDQFTRAGKLAALTFQGAMSNLKDAWTQALGQAFEDVTQVATQRMVDLTNEIVEIDEVTGQMTFNENLLSAFDEIAIGAASALESIYDLTIGIGEFLEKRRLLAEEGDRQKKQDRAGEEWVETGFLGLEYKKGGVLHNIAKGAKMATGWETPFTKGVDQIIEAVGELTTSESRLVESLKSEEEAQKSLAEARSRAIGKQVRAGTYKIELVPGEMMELPDLKDFEIGAEFFDVKEGAKGWDRFNQIIGEFVEKNGPVTAELLEQINKEVGDDLVLSFTELRRAMGRAKAGAGIRGAAPGGEEDEKAKQRAEKARQKALDTLHKINAEETFRQEVLIRQRELIGEKTELQELEAQEAMRIQEIEWDRAAALQKIAEAVEDGELAADGAAEEAAKLAVNNAANAEIENERLETAEKIRMVYKDFGIYLNDLVSSQRSLNENLKDQLAIESATTEMGRVQAENAARIRQIKWEQFLLQEDIKAQMAKIGIVEGDPQFQFWTEFLAMLQGTELALEKHSAAMAEFYQTWRGGLTQLAQEWLDSTAIMRDATQEFVQSASSMLVDNFFSVLEGNIEDAEQAFRDFAKNILKMIAEIMIRQAIARAFMGWNSGGDVIGGMIAGYNPAAGIHGGAYLTGGFKAFAAGGIVREPTIGLIGEGGMDEAVVPMPNGKIPVDLRGQNNQDQVINMTIKLAPDLFQMGKTSPEEIEMVVNSNLARNGTLRKQIRSQRK